MGSGVGWIVPKTNSGEGILERWSWNWWDHGAGWVVIRSVALDIFLVVVVVEVEMEVEVAIWRMRCWRRGMAGLSRGGAMFVVVPGDVMVADFSAWGG